MIRHSTWLGISCLAVQLFLAGCGGGGGGLSSLFGGGGGSSGAGDVFSALISGGSDVAGGGTDSAASVTSVATVHNPEPASVALFGGGLVGLAYLRRRKAQRAKPAKR